MKSDRREFITAATSIAAGVHVSGLSAAAPNKKLRVGQIGVGHAHATKLSVYRKSVDWDVVGIVEPNAALRDKAKDNPAFRNLPWMTQEQLLNMSDLDAVLVETEVCDLLNTAEQCVAANKHVHIDKPAGESLPQFERILKLADAKKLMVQMGYMYRYNPGIVLLREFLRQGWLGDVFEVHTVMSKFGSQSLRDELAQYPGGTMFELGCHILDLVIGVLGKPDDVHGFNNHASSAKDNLLDNMLAVLSYPRATATIKTTVQEVNGFDRRHFVVCGTGGTFHIQPLDRPSAKIALSEPRGKYKRGYQDVTFPRYERYVADAADMARVIRGEKESDFPSSHDLIVQQTLLQACGLPIE